MTTITGDILKTKPVSRAKGLFSKKTVDIIIPFYNEEGNVAGAHGNVEKLEALFHITNFIYINNGSQDQTLMELEKLQSVSQKVKIVQVDENIGYGNGFKKGFEVSTSDYVITNHADQQFDAFRFYSNILDSLKTLPKGCSVFAERKGRPIASAFFTRILRLAISMIIGSRLKEFNGQPKLIDKSSLKVPIDQFPNDFSFDLMLYLASGGKKFYPITEQPREEGQSSWNKDLGSKYRLFKSYLRSANQMNGIIKEASAKS